MIKASDIKTGMLLAIHGGFKSKTQGRPGPMSVRATIQD